MLLKRLEVVATHAPAELHDSGTVVPRIVRPTPPHFRFTLFSQSRDVPLRPGQVCIHDDDGCIVAPASLGPHARDPAPRGCRHRLNLRRQLDLHPNLFGPRLQCQRNFAKATRGVVDSVREFCGGQQREGRRGGVGREADVQGLERELRPRSAHFSRQTWGTSLTRALIRGSRK